MKYIDLSTKRIEIVAGLAVILASASMSCGQSLGEEAVRGTQAITAYGCSSCHTIPGIKQANGIVGPPLNFWAARSYIAGALINEPDNLVHWVMDPQAVEPGTAMPGMGVSEPDARSIGAYLYTLHGPDRGHVMVHGFTGDSNLPTVPDGAGHQHVH